MSHMCAHIIGMMSWTDCLPVGSGCCSGVEPLFREGRADRVHPRRRSAGCAPQRKSGSPVPASFRMGRNSFGEGVRLYGELRGLMRNSGMLKCKITLCAACFFAFFLFLWANRKYCKIGAIQEQL